jgi:hypothetical protein
MDTKEIDRQIATKVMGWKIFETTKDWIEAGEPLGYNITVLDQSPRFVIPS